MKNNVSRESGFTLVEIMIVVAIIGLLATIAIPNLNKAVNTTHTNVCISNLRNIADAKASWQLENRKQTSDTPTGSDIQPYLGRSAGGELPCCPNDGSQTFANSYSPNNNGTKPTCLIMPTNHILQ